MDDSSTAAARPATSQPRARKRSPSKDLPSFTFIDHDDNLASKRIRDKNARKAIRSHVMRDVRRRERLAGLKRVSKRPKKKQTSPDEDSSESNDQLVLSSSGLPLETGFTLTLPTRTKKPPAWNLPGGFESPYLPTVAREPGPSLFDPFCNLPGPEELRPVISNLIVHLSQVMLPMTFPLERKHPLEVNSRMEVLLRNALIEPGPFFATLSLTAAHKAILRTELVEYSELDHRIVPEEDVYLIKSQTILEINRKLADPSSAADEANFGSVIFLITSAVTIGLWTEAQIHFSGLKKMVEYRGGINSPSLEATHTLGGVLLCDVKIACGLLRRPCFPITWEIVPTVPSQIADRIFPPKRSALSRIASKLRNSPHLSDTLKTVVNKMREMIFFEVFNFEDSSGLNREELEFFRMRTHELEHELLDYPYRIFSKTGTDYDLDIPPIENVARLASLCYISYHWVVAPPNSGVGRAITNHTKMALEGCPPDEPTRLPDDFLDLLAWASFVGVQSAGVQNERPFFLHRIRRIAMLRGWMSWRDVEKVVRGYIYLPTFHVPHWEKIWDEAMSLALVTEVLTDESELTYGQNVSVWAT